MVIFINLLVRVAAMSNRVFAACPQKSSLEIISLIGGIKAINPDIILFPAGCLTGGQCGDMLKSRLLIEQCTDAVNAVAGATKKLESFIVLGSTMFEDARPISVAYLLHNGEIMATITDNDLHFLFSIGDAHVNVFTKGIECLSLSVGDLAKIGADITLFPSYTPATALSIDNDVALIKAASAASSCVIGVANGGIGDTSYPRISKGYAGVFECGEMSEFEVSLERECVSVYDVDIDIVRAKKARRNLPIYAGDVICGSAGSRKSQLMRKLNETPYLPMDTKRRAAYLDDLFKLQAASLARRMKNIRCEKLIIGVSGGLDSTLALLVSAQAMDMLGLPRVNIGSVTMQGMGTSGRTLNNARILMESLGCTISEIPIKDAVMSHLRDIGHQGGGDVTYENAQARERTQILFDMANMLGAIVVGTGDLSESALGFCTFGGDQLASFNVNICLTKTVIRAMTVRLAETAFCEHGDILSAIVDTPISPELLPPDKNGDISQKTETILGEYELHDLFLYYFVKYNFTPEKLLNYACATFPKKYERKYIAEKLKIFLKRFYMNQFKRSCAVDSSIITDISLNGFSMPSDISSEFYEILERSLAKSEHI